MRFESRLYVCFSPNSNYVKVRHIRWRHKSGRQEHFFDDELVAASVDVAPAKLRTIEPFPTQDLAPYDTGHVAGWAVERYQINLVETAHSSRETIKKKPYSMCAGRVPGDTRRDLDVDANYSGQTFKHILAPIWFLGYSYGARKFQVVINGYRGEVAGDYPKSWIKITSAVLMWLPGRPILNVAKCHIGCVQMEQETVHQIWITLNRPQLNDNENDQRQIMNEPFI
jgi:hypothetical protein